MDPIAHDCKMLGYCTDQKGYRLWYPKIHKVVSSRDVVFFENAPATQKKIVYLPFSSPQEEEPVPTQPSEIQVPHSSQQQNTDLNQMETSQLHQDEPPTDYSEDTSDEEQPQQLRRSSRAKKKSSILDDYVLYSAVSGIDEPRNYQEAT